MLKAFRWVLTVSLAIISMRCATTPPIPVTNDPICLGSMTAENFIVFLHGMDSSKTPGGQPSLRNLLSRIGTDRNIRFAVPQSRLPCPTEPGWRCWGWGFSDKEVEASAQTIQSAVRTCFPKDAPYGLVGFSNGGYLVSKLYRNCLGKKHLPAADLFLAIAAPPTKDLPRDIVDDLSSCGRFRILSESRLPATGYARHLQKRGGDVQEVMFNGGHIVPEVQLRDMISGWIEEK